MDIQRQRCLRNNRDIPSPQAIGARTRSIIDGKCWPWGGPRLPNGYGYIRCPRQEDGRRPILYAHRVIYEAVYGPLPPGYEPDHVCQHKWCFNPTHLEMVTHKENMHRAPNIKAQMERTACLKGHEYNEENTRLYKGKRQCRTCDAWSHQEKRRKKRGLA